MQDFHDLEVWRRAHKLALDGYRNSKELPREEGFGITLQMISSLLRKM